MKTSELRSKSADQLNETLADLKKEAFNLRFQKRSGELEKTNRIREVRRGIARVKTLINQSAAAAKPVKKAKSKKATKEASNA